MNFSLLMCSLSLFVRFIDLEGGFYWIITDSNKSYYPINLDQEFQEDGLIVWFEAKIRKDIATIHMGGHPSK